MTMARYRNGALPMRPMPQMSGSAFFVTFRSRLAEYRPRLTPVIPAAHVMTPKMRLTLYIRIHYQFSVVLAILLALKLLRH